MRLTNTPFPYTVGRIALCRTIVAVDTHQAVTVETMHRRMRTVNRYLVMVHAKAITLSIAI